MMCVLWGARNRLRHVLIRECQISRGDVYDCHISCAGNIIIQARVTTGVDEAFQTSVELPLRKWIRLDCYIHDSEVQKPGSCLREVRGKELRKHSLGQHPPLLFVFSRV